MDVEHQLPSVNIDYKQATVDAVTQLAKHNKKIAFVSGPLVDDINGKIRLSGYKEALKAKKLSYSEGLVFESSTVTMKVTTWQNESLRQKQQLPL